MTGKAIDGSLKDRYLNTKTIEVTTIAKLKKSEDEVLIAYSNQSRFDKFSSMVLSRNSLYHKKGGFPFGFKNIIGILDDRLSPFTVGLGVIIRNEEPRLARFYPLINLKDAIIHDIIENIHILVEIDNETKVPIAYFTNHG